MPVAGGGGSRTVEGDAAASRTTVASVSSGALVPDGDPGKNDDLESDAEMMVDMSGVEALPRQNSSEAETTGTSVKGKSKGKGRRGRKVSNATRTSGGSRTTRKRKQPPQESHKERRLLHETEDSPEVWGLKQRHVQQYLALCSAVVVGVMGDVEGADLYVIHVDHFPVLTHFCTLGKKNHLIFGF